MKTVVCILLAIGLANAGFLSPIEPRFLKDSSRIVGGDEAPPHAFPHQVAVMSDVGFCGGSLISPTTILTAAHCTDGATEIEVVLGGHDLNEDEPTQIHMITTKFLLHEKWSRPTLENDISLVYLQEPVKESDVVKIIALPKKSDADFDFDRHWARMSGWGRTGDGEGTSNVLKYITVQIISNEECSKTHGSYVRNTTICASGEGNLSTCQGDSGGPLITYRDGKWIEIGIASFVSGRGCSKSKPHAYARVSKFLDWIEEHSDVQIEP